MSNTVQANDKSSGWLHEPELEMFVTSYKLDVEDAELADKFKFERESPFQGCMVDLSRFEDWNADLALPEDQRSEKH